MNVKALGIITTGGTGFVANKPVKSVEELKGLKVRARGVQAAAFDAAGAAPVSIPWNDVYEALSKGVVEGSTNYIIVVRPIRHNEVADYFVAAGLGQAVQLELINRDFWDALPDDIKKVMEEALAEAEQRYAKKSSELAVAEVKALADASGAEHMDYISFPADEREKWIAMSPDFFAEWAEENKGAADTAAIVKSYKDLEKKYVEEGKKAGLVDMW